MEPLPLPTPPPRPPPPDPVPLTVPLMEVIGEMVAVGTLSPDGDRAGVAVGERLVRAVSLALALRLGAALPLPTPVCETPVVGLTNMAVKEGSVRTDGVGIPLALGLLDTVAVPVAVAPLALGVGTSVTAERAVMQGEEQLLVDPEGLKVGVE